MWHLRPQLTMQARSPGIVSSPGSSQRQRGFTLIELLFVIALIAIISVFVIPKWTVPALNIEFEARRVLDDIRYAQALSMATGQRYYWTRLSATTYTLGNESGTPVVLPGGGSIAVLTAGVTISSLTNMPSNLIAFDSLGAPYVASTYPGTALSTTANINLTTGTESRSISILPQTGYGALS